MINPHTIFNTFARLKFFYAKSPFKSDFKLTLLCTHCCVREGTCTFSIALCTRILLKELLVVVMHIVIIFIFKFF